jgi:hypothetical protein
MVSWQLQWERERVKIKRNNVYSGDFSNNSFDL